MKPETSKTLIPPQVDAWLGERSASERHSLEKTWRLVEEARPAMDASDQRRKTEVWNAISAVMSEPEREDMPRPHLRLIRGNPWQWMAAAAVIAVLVGVAYMLRPVTVHAPNGELAQATLPDGSLVQLNSGSSITYRARFLGTRTVRLEGEAFFDVVKDDDSFVVETFNATTTVLGTKFNVRARQDGAIAFTSVAVATGRVRLNAKGETTGGAVLTPGLGSRVNVAAAVSVPAPIVIEREVSWRNGGFAFNDQPLSVIFAEIERRYDLEVQSSNDILRESFSYFVHDRRTAEAVISEVAQAKGFRYRQTANGFEVYRP